MTDNGGLSSLEKIKAVCEVLENGDSSQVCAKYGIQKSQLKDWEKKFLSVVDEEKVYVAEEYETIFNNTQDAIFIIEVEGQDTFRYLRTNKAYQLLTGISLEEIRGKTPMEIFSKEIAKKLIANYRCCYENKSSICYQETLGLPAGEKDWHTVLSPVIKEGQVLQIVGSSRDISQQEEIQEKLRAEEAKFKSYINNAPYGVFICNRDGEYIEVNKTASVMTGYDKEELIGMNFMQLIPLKDHSIFQKSFNQLLEKGKYYVEVGLLRKNGRIKYWSINSVQISENCFIAFTNDITKSKQIEDVLEEQQAYFQQLFDKSPEGIALLDNQERVAMINRSFEEIFEYSSPEIEGRNIDELLLPQSKISESKWILDKLKRGQSYSGESARETKSGKQIDVSIKAFPIKLGNNQLGIYVIYKDITERKAEEARIKYLSFHDQLTGLYNRRYFENEMKRLDKSRRLPISILIADMDGLKGVNDNYGHKEGDRYIKAAGDIIDDSTREEDVVARIGGDEFAIILPAAGSIIAQKIRQRIIAKCKSFTSNLEPKLSVSVGFATKNSNEQDLNQIFKKADSEMYEVKRATKGL